MLALAERPAASPLSLLAALPAEVRESAAGAPAAERAETVFELLRISDALHAAALCLLDAGEIAATACMPAEMELRLRGRRTPPEASMLVDAAALLRQMPRLRAAFLSGDLSWGQVRFVVSSARRLDAAQRARLDERIGERAFDLRDADTECMTAEIDDWVAAMREPAEARREDRRIETSFLAVQGRLDGSATLYGEADAESAATILEALDAAAPPPHRLEELGITRARQRLDALVSICERSLAGDTSEGQSRPRPRLLAIVETDGSGRLLWGAAGRPARLSRDAVAALVCDATVVPVVHDGRSPVAVGAASRTVSDRVRTALVARDRGCRFPACGAPAQWTDAHHVVPGRGRHVQDLILLCRRCHRRVHRWGWKITLDAGGGATFERRGRRLVSPPRDRPIPLE